RAVSLFLEFNHYGVAISIVNYSVDNRAALSDPDVGRPLLVRVEQPTVQTALMPTDRLFARRLCAGLAEAPPLAGAEPAARGMPRAFDGSRTRHGERGSRGALPLHGSEERESVSCRRLAR